MTDIYNYKKNITITTTPNGDVVVTMNKAIWTAITNYINDAARFQKEKNLNATSEDTMKLWRRLVRDN